MAVSVNQKIVNSDRSPSNSMRYRRMTSRPNKTRLSTTSPGQPRTTQAEIVYRSKRNPTA